MYRHSNARSKYMWYFKYVCLRITMLRFKWMGHKVTEQKRKNPTRNDRKWFPKLPKTCQTPPAAAGEGLQTATEKKSNKAKNKGKTTKCKGGDEDEFSLLQGRPRHVPALSWTARGHSRWWCSPAEARGSSRGSDGAPGGEWGPEETLR